MPPVIILDTGPLSNCVVQFAKPQQAPTLSQQCREWLNNCEEAGAILMVPAIAYYEALRELERRQAVRKIERLKAFSFLQPDRFIPLTTAHLEAAAQMWGIARNSGTTTSSDAALDADIILSAQALSLGLSTKDFIIATTNPSHLSRFAPSDLWTNIHP
jgi:predicted nucleic acid-binding protein